MTLKTPANHRLLVLLSILLLVNVAPSHAAKVLSCTDEKGRQIFTDNAKKCGKHPISERQVEVFNSHSQFGQVDSKEYYNYANRSHTRLTGFAINIIAETELLENYPTLTHQAAKRLEVNILKALNLFPAAHRASFKDVRYSLFNGNESSYGGKDSGLWYFKTGNNISKRFDNSIIVNSASNFLYLSDEWALAVAIHELAHGFHYYNWRRIAKLSTETFESARAQGLYKDVETKNGEAINQAYALKNRMEYFAELSVFFFAQHYYTPFNRNALAQYDPAGFSLMQMAWLQAPR